jgi:hypothetical protein
MTQMRTAFGRGYFALSDVLVADGAELIVWRSSRGRSPQLAFHHNLLGWLLNPAISRFPLTISKKILSRA